MHPRSPARPSYELPSILTPQSSTTHPDDRLTKAKSARPEQQPEGLLQDAQSADHRADLVSERTCGQLISTLALRWSSVAWCIVMLVVNPIIVIVFQGSSDLAAGVIVPLITGVWDAWRIWRSRRRGGIARVSRRHLSIDAFFFLGTVAYAGTCILNLYSVNRASYPKTTSLNYRMARSIFNMVAATAFMVFRAGILYQSVVEWRRQIPRPTKSTDAIPQIHTTATGAPGSQSQSHIQIELMNINSKALPDPEVGDMANEHLAERGESQPQMIPDQFKRMP